jgi:hypothetical protein
MSPAEPYLLNLIDEEWSYIERVIKAGQRVVTRIRHHWTEDCLEEHAEWLSLSKALLAANERTFAQGRPGLNPRAIDILPFSLNTAKISGGVVDTALRKLLPHYPADMPRLAMDGNYMACTQADFMRFLAWDWTNTYKPYLLETWDCDDFAWYLAARCRQFDLNAVGMVIDYSAGHAYNVVVFKDGTASIWEPQNDHVVQPGTGIYLAQRGYVIL